MRPLETFRIAGLAAVLVSSTAAPQSVVANDFPSGTWNGSGASPMPSPPPPTSTPFPSAGAEEPQPAPKPKPRPRASKPKTDKTAVRTDAGGNSGGRASRSDESARIVVKVNDEPITAREVSQRQRMMGGSDIQDKVKANMQRLIKSPQTTERLKAILNEVVKANEGKSRDQIIAIFEARKKSFAMGLQQQAIESARNSVSPAVRKSAKDALIEERLKLQAAKAAGVTVADDVIDKQLAMIAQRNNMTLDQFGKHLKTMGMDLEGMKARTRADMAWIDVVRRKFGHQISITSRDVDRIVAAGPAGEDGTELHLQRISLQLLNKVDQAALAKRQLEAEAARAKFSGCQQTASLAHTIPGARFEDIGSRMPTSIPEPTRSLLLAANDGEMLPPAVGPTGVELWVVCSRKAVSADKQKREAAQDEAKQAEFQILAKKYLRDLRQDAVIDDLETGGS
jgi:peptidyl-prolyl cis-trans isomerase SurA